MKDVYSTEIDAAFFAVGKAGLAIYRSPWGQGAVGAKDKPRSARVISTAHVPTSSEPTVKVGAYSTTLLPIRKPS